MIFFFCKNNIAQLLNTVNWNIVIKSILNCIILEFAMNIAFDADMV